jgi:isocitrate dehydrogenase
MLSKIVS